MQHSSIASSVTPCLVQRGPLLQRAGGGGLDGGAVGQRVRVGHPQLNHVGADLHSADCGRAALHVHRPRGTISGCSPAREGRCSCEGGHGAAAGRTRTSSSFLMAATVVAASGSHATKKGMKAVLRGRQDAGSGSLGVS